MGFAITIDTKNKPRKNPVFWNPYNKVVQDHRDGTIDIEKTNRARKKRGLPVPWTPDMADIEGRQKPVY